MTTYKKCEHLPRGSHRTLTIVAAVFIGAGCIASGVSADGFFLRKSEHPGSSGEDHRNGFLSRGACGVGQSVSACRGQALSWDIDTGRSRTRSTDAAGPRGSYSGTSTRDRNSHTKKGIYTGSNDQSRSVTKSYDQVNGRSRSVTCINANGSVVPCP